MAFFTAFTAGSDTEVKAKLRRGVMAVLNDVRGAENGDGGGGEVRAPRGCGGAGPGRRVAVLPTALATRTGWRASEEAA